MSLKITLPCLFFSFFLYRYQEKINALTQLKIKKILLFLEKKSEITAEIQSEFISLFLSYLKAGDSLDCAKEKSLNKLSAYRDIILSTNSLLYRLYHSALVFGSPISPIMTLYKKSLDHQVRFQKSIKSISSQINLQAVVLCLIPLFLFAGISLIEHDWIADCFNTTISLSLFSLSLSLTTFSFVWISRIQKAILKDTNNQKTRDLSNLILHTILFLNSGQDAESAHQASLREQSIDFQSYYNSHETHELFFDARKKQYMNLMDNSIHLGSPIVHELFQIIDDLYFQEKLLTEEKLKKLPIYLLAPLFLCSFPSCVLVLAGILYPKFSGF